MEFNDPRSDKTTVYITEEMGSANYNPFALRCLFCDSFHKLPDKYWCIEHDCEITEYGMCDKFNEGTCVKEIIAEVGNDGTRR